MLRQHVKHFLKFFGGIDRTYTFSWMNGETNKVIRGRGTVFGNLDSIGKWEEELAIQGETLPTLHITLNESDLQGRKRQNIKAYRVLCCDIDRKISEETLLKYYKKYKVQMVVRSSPGKYHFYWKLERGSDLDLWRKLQLGISEKLRGDLQLSLPTSMIRVPGFPRIAKDGKKIMPSILAFKDENTIEEFTTKAILKMWPWVLEKGEAGEKKLKKQRQDAAKIARELMRSRGKDYDCLKFARMTPDAGRNNTLYLSVYDIVYSYESKLSLEEALSYGEDINSSFESPLEAYETEKTVRSAWEHALRARKKKAREQAATLEMLDKVSKLSAKEMAKLKKKARKQARKETREKEKDLTLAVTNAVLGPPVVVPETYLDISNILADRLWLCGGAQGVEDTQNIMAAAYKTRHFRRLTEYMVEHLKSVGAFRVDGFSVYLRGSNAMGEPVRFLEKLDYDSAAALIGDILNRLYLYCVKVSLNGHESKSSVSEGEILSKLEEINKGD